MELLCGVAARGPPQKPVYMWLKFCISPTTGSFPFIFVAMIYSCYMDSISSKIKQFGGLVGQIGADGCQEVGCTPRLTWHVYPSWFRQQCYGNNILKHSLNLARWGKHMRGTFETPLLGGELSTSAIFYLNVACNLSTIVGSLLFLRRLF